MKHIIFLILITLKLFALNIILNSAKENSLPYAVLHIIDSDYVKCKTIPLSLDKKSYICSVDRIVKTPLEKKDLRLVSIDFLEKDRNFYIKIDPKVKSKIIPINEYLYNKKEVTSEYSRDKTHHWVILLYNKAPFGENEDEEGINFPVTYDKYIRPSIGPVDLNGAPISYARGKDINYYIDIQKEFEKEEYDRTIKDVDRVLKQFPRSIFRSELELYKLRALDISIDENLMPVAEKYTSRDIITLARLWMKEFSSDENIPEVLFILAKNYFKSGSSSDANYFLDILVTEHEKSKFTKKAILYFADSLYSKNETEKAVKLYEDVLYSAQDLDIASEAAIRLANSKISEGKISEAREYLLKVLKANKKYLLKDIDASHKLSKKLASNALYDIAASINELLYKSIKEKFDERKEILLKESGDWYAKANKINKAYEAYQKYKKEYKDGIYIDEVNKALDSLFFRIRENNTTKLLKYYDVLIKKYDNDISDKAVIEKAKLLYKEKRYDSVLKMKEQLEKVVDSNSTSVLNLIKESAKEIIDFSLKQKDCEKAVNTLERYDVNISEVKNQDELYKCLIKSLRYKKSKELVQKNLKDKNLKNRLRWLERDLEVNYYLHNYRYVTGLKDDLFTLSKILKKRIEAKYLSYLFSSYMKLNNFKQALKIAEILEKDFPKNVNNIEIYFKIVKYANSRQDDLLLVKYARKAINLQNSTKAYIVTPDIEFLYIEALKRLNRLKEAKSVALELLSKKIKDSEKIRILYLLGEISMKLNKNKEAKEYFQKCSQVNIENSWKNLCKDNLSLF